MAKVLVVDDAEDIRLLMSQVLRIAGFDVAEATSGHDALRLLAEDEPPVVAVIDVQMPEMDGWETLTAVRGNPATADLPVLLCTVKSGTADILRAWQLGCDGYLTKPFAIADLIGEVQALTTRSMQERLEVRRSHSTS